MVAVGVHAMPEVGGELVLQNERDNHGRHISSAWRILEVSEFHTGEIGMDENS